MKKLAERLRAAMDEHGTNAGRVAYECNMSYFTIRRLIGGTLTPKRGHHPHTVAALEAWIAAHPVPKP